MSALTVDERLAAAEAMVVEIKEMIRHLQSALSDDRVTFTVGGAAKRLGLDRPSMQALVDDGTVPAIRIGKRTLVARHKIEAMLAEAVG